VKKCLRCGETKPLDEFHRWRQRDGHQQWCKPCRRDYDRAYYQRNRERRAQQKRSNHESFDECVSQLEDVEAMC